MAIPPISIDTASVALGMGVIIDETYGMDRCWELRFSHRERKTARHASDLPAGAPHEYAKLECAICRSDGASTPEPNGAARLVGSERNCDRRGEQPPLGPAAVTQRRGDPVLASRHLS